MPNLRVGRGTYIVLHAGMWHWHAYSLAPQQGCQAHQFHACMMYVMVLSIHFMWMYTCTIVINSPRCLAARRALITWVMHVASSMHMPCTVYACMNMHHPTIQSCMHMYMSASCTCCSICQHIHVSCKLVPTQLNLIRNCTLHIWHMYTICLHVQMMSMPLYSHLCICIYQYHMASGHAYACIYVYLLLMYTYMMYMQVHVHICICICIWCTYIYMCICTYSNTYIYILDMYG